MMLPGIWLFPACGSKLNKAIHCFLPFGNVRVETIRVTGEKYIRNYIAKRALKMIEEVHFSDTFVNRKKNLSCKLFGNAEKL